MRGSARFFHDCELDEPELPLFAQDPVRHLNLTLTYHDMIVRQAGLMFLCYEAVPEWHGLSPGLVSGLRPHSLEPLRQLTPDLLMSFGELSVWIEGVPADSIEAKPLHRPRTHDRMRLGVERERTEPCPRGCFEFPVGPVEPPCRVRLPTGDTAPAPYVVIREVCLGCLFGAELRR